jgi:hypothetical protein
MAVNTTAIIKCGIEWVQTDVQALTRLADIGSVLCNENILDGSGDQEVNMIWHDVITIASGGIESINIQSLNRVIFGKEVTVGFESVKGIAVRNQSEDIGAFVTITASGGTGFVDMFGGDTGTSIIHPKCADVFSNIIEGWPVSSSNNTFFINDVGGSGCTLEIIIVGCSGSGA